MTHYFRRVIVAVFLFVSPTLALAQSGGIAGSVRDTTGAVLPGVTVEAASPALIEKVRTVVTDGSGAYKVVDLRPGTYSVTFTLPGFASVRQEGVTITTGFTASVNADLKVGSLEETVSVTGASPLVDVQNVRTQTVISHELLDAVPTNKTHQGMAALTLGATMALGAQDVGGNTGETPAATWGIHGTTGFDSRLLLEGMPAFFSLEATGMNARHQHPNQASIQETTIVLGSGSAEFENGGPQMNLVPKDGGNRTTLYAAVNGAGPAMQANNVTPELRSRGLTGTATTKKLYNLGGGIGGALKTDSLWYYASAASWGSEQYQPGIFYNATPHSSVYTPDLDRQGYTSSADRSYNGRITWQVSQNNRFNTLFQMQQNCFCLFQTSGIRAPEASTTHRYSPQILVVSTWSHPRTARLLFEAGNAMSFGRARIESSAGSRPDDIAMLELSTGLTYNAKLNGMLAPSDYSLPGEKNRNDQINQRVAVSYVTGSHAFKVGASLMRGWRFSGFQHSGSAVRYEFLRGVPSQITQSASPNQFRTEISPNVGIFAQDQWTIRNLTLNLGIRYDYFNGYGPPEDVPAGPWVPARRFEEVRNTPNWKDVSPRLGAAYDLFGNGRTAVKASLGRFVAQENSLTTLFNMPSTSIVALVTRTWNDANGNIVPDCDLRSLTGNGECGPVNNTKFGTPNITQRYEDEVVNGFGSRGFHWQTSASLQHELGRGVGMNVGYFRTWYGNFLARNNLALTANDYNSYCITTPTDARLPGGGGQQICGLYDVSPARFGAVDNAFQFASNLGKQQDVYSGLDISLNARFGQGGLLQGGISTGRQMTDNCYLNDYPQVVSGGNSNGAGGPNLSSPNLPRTEDFCRLEPPLGALTQFKLNGVYPLPWNLSASAVFQNLAGPVITANYNAPNALIAQSLGRNIAACGTRVPCTATVPIPIVPNNTMFGERINQVDLRFSRTFSFGRGKAQAQFDIYNAFNASYVLAVNTTYGASWQRPLQILGGRLFKFGMQMDF